jgi:crotonobetainyl-CoA:carnitine CoA-transferase CaiB-like acyl-CoA transferase
MYAGIRVLDCCDERGIIAGQMLADMGAEVIAVEPPAGNTARRLPPFAGDQPGIERSLYWMSYARNKRSITLDTASDDGRALLDGLLAVSDALLLSGREALEALGGYDALAARNPRLIVACVSPFGLAGPKSGYAATDLTVMASSGATILSGDPDRAPLRGTLPQSWLHAGADAAVGVLLALAERERSGRGQLVTISAQISAMNATQVTIVAAGVGNEESRRASGGVYFGGIDLRFTYPCKDGSVSITLLFGTVAGIFTRRLMEWVHEEGFIDEATLNKDWVAYGLLLVTGQEPIAEYERVKQAVTDFTRSHTKAELFAEALKRQVLLAPCATPADLVQSTQLAARDYFWHVPSPTDGQDVAVPGAFAKLPRSPLTSVRPAPSLGEHNVEVYGDLLDIAPDELAALRGAGII